VVNIGRRGGKTTLAIEEMKGLAFYREARVCYIAPTYQQARDIAWNALKKELKEIVLSINESRLELVVRNNKHTESTIFLRGWEAVESLRGQYFDFLVIDEVAMMRNFWANWQEVLRPTLTDRKGQVLFISTPKGFNHFYDLYNLEGIDSDYKSFHFTSYDNPHVPSEEIDKAKLEVTEDRFAQEYMADFRKTEGLVYKEFSRERHCYDEETHKKSGFKIPVYEKIAGIDFGYTHPTAMPWITIDQERRYWVTDEFYKTGLTDAEVADYVAQCKFSRVFPDPESPSAIAELRKRGVNVRQVIKNRDSVKAGIQMVRELFKANRLFINKKCINLISELESYSYPDMKDGKIVYNEVPLKENDDLLDAMRYALTSAEKTTGTKASIFYPQNAGAINTSPQRVILKRANVFTPSYKKPNPFSSPND
jgi:PBSX family phage terminase large subunit